MSFLALPWVIDEIGGLEQWQFVVELIEDHLGREVADPTQLLLRIAPSLISRSECELFSTSAPRFAVRVELPDGSFMNLRRLRFLAKTCANIDWVSVPASGRPTESIHAVVSKNIGAAGRCIADSVFVPPRHRYGDEKWHTLTAPLGRAYGECGWGDEREILGTPFVRQMLLGGGMCAQAACFMATALLHEYAVGVHGVSEITALADSDVMDGNETELALGGIDVEAVSRYFEGDCVGLRAPAISLPLSIVASIRQGAAPERFHCQAVRSYVLSGFPVIQSLDFPRLLQAESYAPLRESLASQFDDRQNADDGLNESQDDDEGDKLHAVVIVGASLDRTGDLLVNDPSYLPFRRVSQRELSDAAHIGETSLTKHPIMPITPREVQLPLFTPTPVGKGGVRQQRGLDYLLSVPSGLTLFDDPSMPEEHLFGYNPDDEFRLFDVQSDRDYWLRTLCRGDSISSAAISLFDAWLAGADGDSLSWIWSRHRRHGDDAPFAESIVFCDATRRIPKDQSGTLGPRRNLLLCALVKLRGGDWRLLRIGRRNVRPSAITSYTSSTVYRVGSTLSLHEVEPQIEALEWYSFMQTEVSGGRRRRRAISDGIGDGSILEYMANYLRLGGPPLEGVLQELVDDVDKARRGRPVVALATFIPTVSLPPHATGAGLGRDALIFVARIAEKLAQRQDFDADKKMVIEIVAGSRVKGLSLVAKRKFSAAFLSQQESAKNFLDNLKAIVAATAHLPVIWAVELEPGPLFTIRDWDSVCDLCHRLDHEPALTDAVGVNLDISHWRMAVASRHAGGIQRISPRLVRENPDVFRRIVHAHISGHHDRAHFGDIPLDVLNTSDEFRPWISLLRERAACTDLTPVFSGHVSFEFEAAKNDVVAIGAMRDFAMLLARLNPVDSH